MFLFCNEYCMPLFLHYLAHSYHIDHNNQERSSLDKFCTPHRCLFVVPLLEQVQVAMAEVGLVFSFTSYCFECELIGFVDRETYEVQYLWCDQKHNTGEKDILSVWCI